MHKAMADNKRRIPTIEEIERDDYVWDLGEIKPAVLTGDTALQNAGSQGPEPMPSLQANAEALKQAGISTKRYIPDAVPTEPAEPVATQTKEPAVTAAPSNPELDALGASHQNQMDALRNYNQQQYNNLGEIISAADAKMKEAQQKDEAARRRENAFRYISGLGDTLSSVANLVGTANDASHQQQKYNSHEVVKKAEAARKARKLEMDDLSKRLDEMKARQRELKASGSLEEAKLKASLDKEKAALLATQRKEAEEKKRYADTQAYRAERDKVEDAYRERRLNIDANKPTTDKSKIVKIMGDDGEMLDFDVSGFKNFDADYQRALASAIADGTSGLSEDELKAYNNAVKLAATDGDRALKEFFRTHTPKQSVIKRMGINNPRYK